jgi:prepilin-type N-terminal cleavage/methylation domain-containing protein
MKITKNHAFTLIELLVVIAIIAVLASIAIPVYGEAQAKAQRTKCLSQAKGVFPALKMFAGDHDSTFPTQRDQDGTAGGSPLSDANDAFANLIPNYLSNESPFGNNTSAWCKKAGGGSPGPDGNIQTKDKILEQGENQYAYIEGLSETSNASYPIIADAFAGGSGKVTDPTYSKTEGAKGAVWKGRFAIIVKADGSATIELPEQTNLTVRRYKGSADNMFSVKSSDTDPWLVGCTVYNPK